MNKNQNQNKYPIAAVLAVLAVVAALVFWGLSRGSADQTQPGQETSQSAQAGDSSKAQEDVRIDLGSGLEISSVGSYTGLYMEDGSDEAVERVMMVILTNRSEKDLQYAQITLNYESAVCEFTVTNLPAGASAVLLEQNRQDLPKGVPVSADVSKVVFFEETMSVHEDIFKISGMDGTLNIKNISETNIPGDIYVYYKYTANELYYGGITFRVKIEGGLSAGEIRQGMTAHYDPDGCTIVAVTYPEL